jgi:thiol-disulfide isomerase/thioredoxin
MSRLAITLLAASCIAIPPVIAADTPSSAPTRVAERSVRTVILEIRAVVTDIQKFGPMPNFNSLQKPEIRTKITPQQREDLVKLAALNDELSGMDTGPSMMTTAGGPKVRQQSERITFLAMAASLDSDDAKSKLATLAASKDRELAVEGNMGLQLAAWLGDDGDGAKQTKILDAIETLARDNPTSNALGMNLRTIRSVPDLPKGLLQRIDDLYMKTLKGPVAEGMQAFIDAGVTQKNALGKPVTLTGKTLDGKDFSTKELAGKVILVDFWATWCGPCVAELPRIKAIFEKYHDQGLEVVGVSCDGDAAVLTKFIQEKNLRWPQFWDKEKQTGVVNGMHPLAAEWKLNGIPQMFLIDRAGILRSVEGRKEFEKLVPKLLEEKPK